MKAALTVPFCADSRSPVRAIAPGLRVHLVGIGGSGMSGLAGLLLGKGARVSGSDSRPSHLLQSLRDRGARVVEQQAPESVPIDAELVVASAAIAADHPEIREARRRGLPVYKYAQMLGRLMIGHEGVAVAGTHGKSTTASWLAYTLRRAGRDPSFVIGAEVEQLGGGSGAGAGREFVAEACEYDRSFMNLRPRRAAILNIEEDHLDCYAGLKEIEEAFTAFAALLPADGLLVFNGHDARCRRLAGRVSCSAQSVGVEIEADWSAQRVRLSSFGCPQFEIRREGRAFGEAAILLAGRHNAFNALAVTALAHDCGLAWEEIRPGLESFRGARRRLELRGEPGGVRIADDYGHHPTEIRATLAAARERFEPRRLWCVFQPHQHSRTRALLEDFGDSFAGADHVIVPDIYEARDDQAQRGDVCAIDLVQRVRDRGVDVEHIPGFMQIVAHLAASVAPGDLVLTMGAGDVWRVADELVRRLSAHHPA
ncbi:MAG: UDP-N-acetylmuramate--L-alanine ligase [Phycisphaerae bacterium]|nr:UDP-N-acetylmuramate--L-alanine ligase [Phycisphaerae bacterium]MCZ2400962.1 UDP-N-acetylmuramate--L-alanine ligase [Phycisphaerae bacterium]